MQPSAAAARNSKVVGHAAGGRRRGGGGRRGSLPLSRLAQHGRSLRVKAHADWAKSIVPVAPHGPGIAHPTQAMGLLDPSPHSFGLGCALEMDNKWSACWPTTRGLKTRISWQKNAAFIFKV